MSSLASDQKTTVRRRITINRQSWDNYQRGQTNRSKRKLETPDYPPVQKRARLELEKERNSPPPQVKCPALEKAQRPSVWIIGDSYIRRGEDMARRSQGTDLGLHAKVTWFGKGGLRWRALVPFFNQCLCGRTVPDLLVIHCGGNDLGQMNNVHLTADMKRDLHNLHHRYPEMKIVLSAINQRRQWLWGAAHPKMIDPSRNWVNGVMDQFVSRVEGCVVHHPDIVFENPRLFLQDNVHLSPLGNDIFLSNIAECLKTLIH